MLSRREPGFDEGDQASPPLLHKIGPASARLGVFGLAGVLVVLAAFAFSGALATYRAASATRAANEISDGFNDAHLAVVDEESLERKYRLEPAPAIRARHLAAAAALVAALERVRSKGTEEDARIVDSVLALHVAYLQAIGRMFAAVDAGDAALVLKIDGGEVDPSFDAIATAVSTAANDHHQAAVQLLARLEETDRNVAIATPIAFALGIGLIAIFGLALRSYRRQAQRAVAREAAGIRLSEQRFRSLVQNASDVILVCSAGGAVIYQSPQAESAWNLAPGGLLGQPLFVAFRVEDQAMLRDTFAKVESAPASTRKIELEMAPGAKEWRYCELLLANLLDRPGVHGIVVTARDITARRAFEQQLNRQAFYDSLTGLPNRALFHDRLEQALARSAQTDDRVGLLFIDLDHFKLVNDSLSHGAGDEVLIDAARRLQLCARSTDTVARLGGDEFILLLANLSSEREAMEIADRVILQFQAPFRLKEREVFVTASVGVAVGRANAIPADTLLRNADTAVYRAKMAGKARRVLFEDSMHIDDLARLELESQLRRAIVQGELRVFYQPIVRIETGAMLGVEALVRWQHPTRGLLLPAEFIPIAEETGLIASLGLFVLNEACRQTMAWQTRFADRAHMTVSVNLSTRQFQEPSLSADVETALSESGLAPSSLKLEITESAIIRDVDAAIATLGKLRKLGIQIAVDDFGTGYSSLAYLKRLPIDALKIDQSFIKGIVNAQEDTAIVQAIITLARSLDLKVTAEGVETAAQSALLQAWNCDRGQGFYFARPTEAAAITRLLASGSAASVRTEAA